MLNKCAKIFLVLLLVALIAFGLTFLPFNLLDKFKSYSDKFKSHLRGLTNFGSDSLGKVHLDLSKRDTYKYEDVNVVMDKVDNDPKNGYFRLLHKGEKDTPLDVEKFKFGDDNLDGLEPALVDYCAAYFKGDFPQLLLVEVLLHDKDATPKTNETPKTEGQNPPPPSPEKKLKHFYARGENNKWVELPEGTDLSEKADQVFAALNPPTNPQPPAPTTLEVVEDEEDGDEEEEEEGEEGEDHNEDEAEASPAPEVKVPAPKVPKTPKGTKTNVPKTTPTPSKPTGSSTSTSTNPGPATTGNGENNTTNNNTRTTTDTTE